MTSSYTLQLPPMALEHVNSVNMGNQYRLRLTSEQQKALYDLTLRNRKNGNMSIDYIDNGELKKLFEFTGGSRRRRDRKSSRKYSNKRANKRSY